MIKPVKSRGNFLNLIKNINKTSTDNIILNGEKLKAFSLKLGTRQKCFLAPLLFNIILEILANAIRKGNKRYTEWEGRNKMIFCFRDDIIIYVKNIKELRKNFWN